MPSASIKPPGQRIEARGPRFEKAAADEVGGAGIAVGSKGLDEVGVGREIFQPIEADLAPFGGAVEPVVRGTGGLVRPEGPDQVRVARDILQPAFAG